MSVQEPVRKSILDVIQKNLQAAGRTMYITRAIYFGEYFLEAEDLQQDVENIINHLKSDNTETLITGLLLTYPRYYIHILEAPECIIYKHFKLLFKDESAETYGKAIPLPSYHHVQQRFFSEWSAVFTMPPTLLATLEVADTEKLMHSCLLKVYSLCECVANVIRDKAVTVSEVFQHLGEKVTQYLPEDTVLRFLLAVESPGLQTVQERLRIVSEVPFVHLYNERIWPPPRDFVPGDKSQTAAEEPPGTDDNHSHHHDHHRHH